MADKYADAQKLAASDLAFTVTGAKLSGTWQVGNLYWDDAKKHTVGEARLTFAADAGDKLGEAPFVAADVIVLEVGPPAKVLAHADATKLRDALARKAQIESAITAARAKLKTLPRYGYWLKEKWPYETRVWLQGKTILVVFDTPAVTDQNIAIEIDPATSKVLSVRLGMA